MQKRKLENFNPIDMRKGKIVKPLILFVLPMIGSSIFQQLYNTVDFIFVGNILNKTSAAAVGASSTLIFCVIGLFSGIAVGTSVVCSQAIGCDDKESADKALYTSVAFGIVGGVILMLCGIFFAPNILKLLNTPVTVMPEAIIYIRIYLLSIPAMIFYNMCSGAMRAIGDAQTPFRILLICGVVNVILDAAFMIIVPMGVAGVAIATVISQGLSTILCVFYLNGTSSLLKLKLKGIRINRKVLLKILRIGMPSGIQTVVITLSNIMVQYYINDFGETVVAAFSTYYKVENFIYFPIVAFGQAMTTFSGQNTGAGQYRRIKRGTGITALMAIIVTICTVSVILLFPETVFLWFMKDDSVVADTLKIALVSFPFYWIYPIMEVVGGSLRGMGYSLSSMVIIITNLCILRVALLALFSSTIHSIQSLAFVYPLTWATASLCFIIVFLKTINNKLQTVRVKK